MSLTSLVNRRRLHAISNVGLILKTGRTALEHHSRYSFLECLCWASSFLCFTWSICKFVISRSELAILLHIRPTCDHISTFYYFDILFILIPVYHAQVNTQSDLLRPVLGCRVWERVGVLQLFRERQRRQQDSIRWKKQEYGIGLEKNGRCYIDFERLSVGLVWLRIEEMVNSRYEDVSRVLPNFCGALICDPETLVLLGLFLLHIDPQ